MTTPQQARTSTAQRTSEGSGSLALPMGLLIIAIVCGAASLALTVFGVWPALLLVLASGGLGAFAVNRIRNHRPPGTS